MKQTVVVVVVALLQKKRIGDDAICNANAAMLEDFFSEAKYLTIFYIDLAKVRYITFLFPTLSPSLVTVWMLML